MPDREPSDLRRHRAVTDRNLLIGFFIVLFAAGGGLILLTYGSGAAAFALGCMGIGAGLAGLVVLILYGLQWLSDWLDRRA